MAYFVWYLLFYSDGHLIKMWTALSHTANHEVASHSCPLVCNALAINDLNFGIVMPRTFCGLSHTYIQSCEGKLRIETFSETVSVHTWLSVNLSHRHRTHVRYIYTYTLTTELDRIMQNCITVKNVYIYTCAESTKK